MVRMGEMKLKRLFNQNPWLTRHSTAIDTVTRWNNMSPIEVAENLTRKCSTQRYFNFSEQRRRRDTISP